MTKLQKLALYEAIRCIEESTKKRREREIYREEPLSDLEKVTLLTESYGFLDASIEWIKACIGKETE